MDDRFWRGFDLPGCPRFDGLSVLELGCGLGTRCFEVASHGAARVIGLDPLSEAIDIANHTLETIPGEWRDRVRFLVGTAETIPPEQFDVIFSENTLEHVVDVPGFLAGARRHLKPNGRFYLAFGPLYHSHDGDHGWLRDVLPGRRIFRWPWGHLYLEGYAIRRLSKLRGEPVAFQRNWPYLHLNRYTVAEFEDMYKRSGMRITYLKRNHTGSFQSKVYAAIGRMPFAAKYFTMNMSVILTSNTVARSRRIHDVAASL
jgi:SAM-dependent methyltransferase